jgi:SAM-dependent methyltransferase
MERHDRVLALIDPATMRGVEVGPSFSPIVPKRSGADVTIVDHADAETLREKYRVHGVDIDAIEDVDVIWPGGSLYDALASRAPFDYIVASHVVEHLPDPLGFLDECHALLVPGGVLSLVLPDRRYCFDCLRPLTSIGQWIDARADGRSRHTPGTVVDHTLHASKRGDISWHEGVDAPMAMVHTRDHVDGSFERASTTEDYIDVHAWVFERASFCYLVEMARALGLTAFEVAAQHETVGSEFYVTLRSVGPLAQSARDAAFDDRLVALLAVRPQPDQVRATERIPASMKAINASTSIVRGAMRLAKGSPSRVRLSLAARFQRARSS